MSTRAAVLVAGLPGRDFPRDSPPKCLLHVEGRVILERLLTAIRDGGVGDIRLVVGYEAKQIERWVEAMGLAVEIAPNPDWRTDAVASMEIGLAGAPGDAYLAWRTKQNYDFGEAFRLSAAMGDYYMHVEDDVIACRDWDLYVFQEMERRPSWGVLRMAQGGAIGFVFRARDLPAAREALVAHGRTKPADWIIEEHVARHGLVRPRYSVFQHVGRHRSLAGATQPVVFEDFIGTGGDDA
jgi:hypothetical protein